MFFKKKILLSVSVLILSTSFSNTAYAGKGHCKLIYNEIEPTYKASVESFEKIKKGNPTSKQKSIAEKEIKSMKSLVSEVKGKYETLIQFSKCKDQKKNFEEAYRKFMVVFVEISQKNGWNHR